MEATTALTFSEKRHELARTGLGGSDAAAVLGLDKYRTALDVWMNCTGRSEREDQSEPAEWGQRLEAEVLRKYAEGLPYPEVLIGRDHDGKLASYQIGTDGKIEIVRLNGGGEKVSDTARTLMDTLRHPDRPHLMAHPDALVFDCETGDLLRLVEAKTAGHWAAKDWGEEGTDEAPPPYIVQAHHYAGVLAANGYPVPQCDVPVLLAGQKYREYPIRISVTLSRNVCDRLDRWWNTYVVADQVPPVEARDNRTLGMVYPEDTGESVFAPDGMQDWARALGEYRDAEKEAKEERARCEAEIKAALGEASEMVGEGWRVTWKKASDSVTVDHEAALDALRTSLEVRGLTDVIALLDECIEDMTTTKPGSRRLLTYGAAKSAKEGDE